MTDHHAHRLLDALASYATDQPTTIQRVLVVGARGNAGFTQELLGLYPSAIITVIDHRTEDAQEFEAQVATNHQQIETVAGGLIDLSELAPGPFDRIISRHPDITMGRSAWHHGLEACIHELDEAGLLIVTTANVADAGFVNDLMEDNQLQMVPGTPYTAVPVAMHGSDRYILIYKFSDDH